MFERRGVIYKREAGLGVREFRQVLVDSGLGEIRPVKEPDRLGRMLTQAGLIVTARLISSGALVGVARCMTDFSWCCYLSDLAVAPAAQGLGVGKALIEAVREELGPEVALFLGSVPGAAGFYEHIGMERIDDAFWFRRER